MRNRVINDTKNSMMSWFPMLIMGFIVYKLGLMFFGKTQAEKDAKVLFDAVKNPDVNKATITPIKAHELASIIFNSFGFFNDNEDAIYRAFGLIVNADDMRLLYKSYGIKTVGPVYNSKSLDLVQSLTEYLSSEELQPIENKLSWL